MAGTSAGKLKKLQEEVRLRRRRYWAALPLARRRVLQSVGKIVRAAEPDAVDTFSYGIPGFKLHGRPLVWCASWKNHFSLYPMTASIRKKFARELKGLETSTGTIQFPFSEAPPLSLIRKLIRARGDEIRKKHG